MAIGIRATGGEEIARVAAACRALGSDRSIVNEMGKTIRREAGKTIRPAVRESVLAKLPSSGGLNVWVARAPVRILVRRGADSAGVAVRVGRNSRSGRADLQSLDAGQVRHPLWGNRGFWYAEAVTPGTISDAIDDEGRDIVEQAVLAAADYAAGRILNA